MSENDDNIVKIMAVCGFCRYHQKNPTIEFNFNDNKVYWLCQECKKMNEMDFSKPLPGKYPKPRRI
jgi:hypothetical protein